MSEKKSESLARECLRQYESCLYTAASLWIYQRSAKRAKIVFVILPILFGVIAGSNITGFFGQEDSAIPLLFSVLAGIFPAVYSALELGMHEKSIGHAAAEFTKLRDEFRRLATVDCHEEFDVFYSKFDRAMERKDFLRRDAPNAPERFFKAAQKKIAAGDYAFWIDGDDKPRLEDGRGG